MKLSDYLIVGGGVVGLTLAIEIKKTFGGSVTILEKEQFSGAHMSGRNSGVLHCGIYYKSNTLKGRLCVKGNETMRAYCTEKSLSQVKGKVIVTRNEQQIGTLLELEKRATDNGAEVHLIDQMELKEIEPHARTVGKALYSPNTTTIDPKQVLGALLEDAKSLGIQIRYGTKMIGKNQNNEIITNNGNLGYGLLINAAGAYADKIAHMYNVGKEYVMLPFKGLYYRLKDEHAHLVKSNIYPVPDIRYPFLGVHFTKTPSGIVKVGPSAIPALAKENYKILDNIKIDELFNSLRYNTVKLLTDKNYLAQAAKEVSKYLPYFYYKDAKKLLPKLEYSYLTTYPNTGIRAQLFDIKKKQLESDFLVKIKGNSVHILNAVSPAFTTSITFAKYVTNLISKSEKDNSDKVFEDTSV